MFLTLMGFLHPLDPELRTRVAQSLQGAADLLAAPDDSEELPADDLLADPQLGSDLLLGPSFVEVELDDAALPRGQARRVGISGAERARGSCVPRLRTRKNEDQGLTTP